ncbi:MAG: uracil-DNA glycosylase [Patescibacteria group bacterium]|nr:uracil-DNA glycosylase [Patescibacteria group bacterium]
MDKNQQMKLIKEEVIACKRCELNKTRTLPVIGQGSHEAKIMFVGEAPGAQENKTGRPFCGAAGKVLDQLLESIGAEREEIYIGNILKCRPPSNRNPELEEIESCTPYLDRQIEIIQPRAIAALGNFSARYLMEKYGLEDLIQGISKMKGQVFSPSGQDFKLIPLFHPAVATYNRHKFDDLAQDFKILKKYL